MAMRASRQLTRSSPSSAKSSRSWLVEWVTSESFWRDVVSRFLSGLLVFLVGVLGAAGTGFITHATARGLLFFIVIVVGYLGLTITTVLLIRRLRRRLKAKKDSTLRRRASLWVALMFSYLLAALCILVTLIYAAYVALKW